MKRIGKFLFGVLFFVALGYLLVFVTKAQTPLVSSAGLRHREDPPDAHYLLFLNGRSVVDFYADEVIVKSYGTYFHLHNRLILVLHQDSGLIWKHSKDNR